MPIMPGKTAQKLKVYAWPGGRSGISAPILRAPALLMTDYNSTTLKFKSSNIGEIAWSTDGADA